MLLRNLQCYHFFWDTVYIYILLASITIVVCPSVHHGYIVAKRYEIGLRLLLITNRKLHTVLVGRRFVR